MSPANLPAGRASGRGLALGLLVLLAAPPATVAAEILAEVVVTARKRAEPLQQTPIAITAFTAADLAQRAESNTGELVGFAPNTLYTIGGANGGSAAQLFIRGIGQVDFAIGKEPGVATYVDGVYLSRTIGALLDLVDVERIEVLRGPQGTLFGRNAIGGALNITSVRPGDDFEGEAQVTIGRFDRRDGRLVVNLPLGPAAALRLTAARLQRDGIGRRLTDGDDVGDIGSSSGRLQLRWTASDRVELNVAADYTRRDEGSYPAVLLTVAEPAAGLARLYNATAGAAAGLPFTPALITGDRYDSRTSGLNVNDQTIRGLAATVDFRIGSLALRSITAWRELEARYTRETDGYPLPLLDVVNDDDQRQLTQELQLSGAGERLRWIAGVFWFDEDLSGSSLSRIGSGIFGFLEGLPGPVFPLAAPPPGTSCAAGTTPPGFPCAGGAGNPLNIALDNDRLDLLDQQAESYALFGELTYDFGDQLALTVGGRYTHEDKEFALDSTRAQSGVKLLPLTRVADRWSNFSPRAGIDWRWNPDLLSYFTVTRGFKAGGFNARARNGTELEPFAPETVLTYELGLKSEWLGRRLRANAAVFYNDYQDIQVVVVEADPNTGQVFSRVENAGEARTSGFELELLARITGALDLSAAVGYTDARYTSVKGGGEFTTNSEFALTPEWTWTIGALYTQALGEAGQLVLRADYAHRGGYFQDAQNSLRTREPGYGLLNASLSWQNGGGNFGIRLFGTNLADTEYLLFGIDPTSGLGFSSGTYGRPREWGLSAFYRF